MDGDGVNGWHVGIMLFAKYNVSSTSDSSVSNTIYIIRFSLIVMEFNILQDKIFTKSEQLETVEMRGNPAEWIWIPA